MPKSHHVGSELPHLGVGMDGDMNWDDIRVFLVLAEEKSFRKAARPSAARGKGAPRRF